MSSDFFRFWRYIQRFSLGAIFALEIIVLLADDQKIDFWLKKIYENPDNPINVINNALIIIFVIFVLGTIGFLLSNIIIGFATFVFTPPIKLFFPIKSCKPYPSKITLLFFPINELVLKTVQDNIDELLEHLYLRSASDTDNSEHYDKLEVYYARLKKYLISITDSNAFSIRCYQNTLTQEQRNIDNFKWDIVSANLILLICVLGVNIVFSVTNIYSFFYAIFLYVLILFITIPEILNRKRDCLLYFAAICGSVYQLAEAAGITDRDSI